MKLLVTGSSGLVGSACVRHFSALGWEVHGIDSHSRGVYFGPDGDNHAVMARLARECANFAGKGADVRDAAAMEWLVRGFMPDLVIHAAAQPSHDYAAGNLRLDFDVNAGGTLNMLEAVRRHVPGATFCHLSTNKVYGDLPNAVDWLEWPTRYENAAYLDEWRGFDETLGIDHCTHSLFGCSKLAADLYVQEYGRYFGMNTVCFRAGCLTGSAHAGAEQHGFLAYLARCFREGRTYRVYGYKGKQVRDQLHARDVARACELFHANPRKGAVYNLGGGRANSVSVLEAVALFERAFGRGTGGLEYVPEPRKGDHVVWITDTSAFRRDYPGWSVSVGLGEIVAELVGV